LCFLFCYLTCLRKSKGGGGHVDWEGVRECYRGGEYGRLTEKKTRHLGREIYMVSFGGWVVCLLGVN